MASKRAFQSLSSIARVAIPAPAPGPATRTILPRRHLPVSLSPTVRLAHSIPRPRTSSPFAQQQQQQSTTAQSSETTTPSSSQSSETTPTTPSTPTPPQQPATNTPNILQQPHYELTFTCVPCGARSRHRVSKQGYHHGTVLIACPSCRNRHVIADHLRVFGDKAMTIEDLLREKGELIKRGTLGEEGDLEFWEDGTTTVREPWVEREKETTRNGDGAGQEELPPGATFKSVRPGDKKAGGDGE